MYRKRFIIIKAFSYSNKSYVELTSHKDIIISNRPKAATNDKSKKYADNIKTIPKDNTFFASFMHFTPK